MTFEQWLPTVPQRIARDPIWKRADYRYATYLSDAAWPHVVRIVHHPGTRLLGDQLFRALGSIGSNISEGYSRGSGMDRVRFYEYALGSARESREWYWKVRHVLEDEDVTAQLEILEQVIRLLLTAIRNERGELLPIRTRRDNTRR